MLSSHARANRRKVSVRPRGADSRPARQNRATSNRIADSHIVGWVSEAPPINPVTRNMIGVASLIRPTMVIVGKSESLDAFGAREQIFGGAMSNLDEIQKMTDAQPRPFVRNPPARHIVLISQQNGQA